MGRCESKDLTKHAVTMKDGSNKLHRIIEDEIQHQGSITFAEFMRLCLYHPEYGYYSSGHSRRGKRGDYYTNPTVHKLFGELLGKQMVQMWKVLGAEAFDIVEMGGGEGYLCQDILGYLHDHEPALYERMKYYMVEVSIPIIEAQKKLLASHQNKVKWYDGREIKEKAVVGCFLSNELIDSFPVHRVMWQDGALHEIYVTLEDGKFKEVLAAPSTKALKDYFQRLDVCLEEGQKAEVNLEALRWLRGVAKSLLRGFVITIDYGYLARELYNTVRMNGTMMCYQGHSASTDLYVEVGRQDMTAHVDFTSLIECGEMWELKCTGLVPQYKFFLGLGILDEIERLGQDKGELEAMAERLTIKNLIFPDGMGATFKVLVQHKGVERPQLDGLRAL